MDNGWLQEQRNDTNTGDNEMCSKWLQEQGILSDPVMTTLGLCHSKDKQWNQEMSSDQV